MNDRDEAAKRLALEFANSRSDKELPPPYDTLDECPDAAHFLELAELAFDFAVVPAIRARDLQWRPARPGSATTKREWEGIPWSAVCPGEKP